MIDAVVGRLRCPLCLTPTRRDGAVVRCASGHSFDVARQGYLNLRVGNARRVTGDTAEMVAARERFLAGGWYAPLAEALVELAAPALRSTASDEPSGPLVVEVGAGTGYYVTAVLDSRPDAAVRTASGPGPAAGNPSPSPGPSPDSGCVGVALDVSKYALRRAARASHRLGAVAADVANRLPFADAGVALLLDVFAPRNAAEMARVLAPEGRLLVVTPGRDHLAEVVGPLGALAVDERKDDRLDVTFAGRFARTVRRSLTYPMRLAPDEIADLVTMGPAGHHLDAGRLRREVFERWPDGAEVTASFVLSCYAPAGRLSEGG